LKRCEWHTDNVMDAGEMGHSYAYRVGNAKLKAGELGDLFDSRREMTDAVKASIEEHALDYCPRCDTLNGRLVLSGRLLRPPVYAYASAQMTFGQQSVLAVNIADVDVRSVCLRGDVD